MNNKEQLQKSKSDNLVEITNKAGVELGVEKVLMQNIALIPKNISTDKIKTSAGFYISNRKDLMDLNNTGKLQMLYGVLKEAMLGLEAGTDYDIVPFKGKPTICRKKEGYFKIIDMIKPAEIVRFINNVITTDDEYYFNPVTGELTHEMHGERYQDFDNIIGSYAYIKFANGFESIVFLSKEDLQKIKDTSPSGKTEFSPWNSQSLKMVKTKTVKELAKELCTLWGNKLNSIQFSAMNSDEVSIKNVDNQGYIENDNSVYDAEIIKQSDENTQGVETKEINIKQVGINEL
ncbi:MAG: recombinase RecT [Bacilli bacterium]|nr:recombinase RecT [Bacilli bacterium]